MELNFPDFTKDDLHKLGITTLGDIKNILHEQKTLTSTTTKSETKPPHHHPLWKLQQQNYHNS